MDDLILEKNLKETLNKKSEEIGGSLADQRIRTRVFEAIEEEKNMKHRNWKKTAVAAAAICILGTMTAVAVGRPAFILSGSSRNEIVRDYGQAVQMQEGYDGRVKSVEGFSNGYTFKEAVPKHEETQDEGKNRLDQGVSMAFTYEKEGMEDVELSGSRLFVGMQDKSSADQVMTLEDGTVLSYSSTVNKFVPPDYEITEEEKKLQEEPVDLSLPVSFGNADSPDIMAECEAALAASVPGAEVLESSIGSVVGTHAGPGCTGIAYFVKE